MATSDFIHPVLNEEIQSISGRYAYLQEKQLEFEGRKILYYTGYGVTDSSCCGYGGCAFCLVAGFVVRWRYRAAEGRSDVSEVEPVSDASLQLRITELLMRMESATQVNFYLS
ncbi:MAG: hypothetical protein JXA20_11575 [Spirochaetes bacterium]|nr:hypothetical protein [Spirochaetota bacterium]